MCLHSIFQKCFRRRRNCLNGNDEHSGNGRHSNASNAMLNNASIIIIGAGAAGLSCAIKLREFGFENILILEAENRIGGRIHTKSFADNVIDLGAQWVHGEDGNVVYSMVEARNCLETSGGVYKTFECIRSNGQIVDISVVERLKQSLSLIFDECGESLECYEGSLGEYLNERFGTLIVQEAMLDIDKEVAMEFFENFKRIESSESSSGVDEVSAKGFRDYWQCAGDYLLNWKDKGYVTFLHLLMGADEDNRLGDLENYIKFECKAEQIHWNRSDHKAVVICDKGNECFEADHVIVTVPLGVLKQHVDSMFYPPLPMPKKCAIVGLGYGSVCKIYLEFAQKFWPNDWYGFTTLWLCEDLEQLRRTQFEWVEEIFGFYCVNYQPRVLVAWIVGPYVGRVERMPAQEIKDGCLYVLRRFLRKWLIPDPTNIQVTHWQSNPNFSGAYSFRSLLTEELNTSAEQLAQPLTVVMPAKDIAANASTDSMDGGSIKTSRVKPILLFAGEATSPHYYSTVHGAVESGRREAERILNFYRGLEVKYNSFSNS